MTRHAQPLPAAAVAAALDRLEQLKVLAGLDLVRLRQLAARLSAIDHGLDVGDALAMLFGQDKDAAKADASLRQMVKRIADQQNEAIAAGHMEEGERLVLVVARKSGDRPRRLWFGGQSRMAARARTGDLDGVEQTLYDSPVLPPELLGQATEAQRPILLLTVNKRETAALRAVFCDGEPRLRFERDDYAYEVLGYEKRRPIVAFRCRMGSVRPGAALIRVATAIDHLKPSVVIAVGVAFGKDDGKQRLGDVLLSEQVQTYESERLNRDGSHVWRSDNTPAAHRWVDRATTVPARGYAVRKGLLLCGEKLVDNEAFRALLTHEFPLAIGGDMEGAGLVAACHEKKVDWLVVKGVSDWGDGHKNAATDAENDAQQYQAALNAARVVYAAIHLKPPPETASTCQDTPACPVPPAWTRDLDQAGKVYDNFAGTLAMASRLHERPGHETASNQTAHGALRHWLERADAPPVFALLGEYGMGKTINCQRLYRELRRLRAGGGAPAWAREPLYFDLRQLSLFKNLDRHGVVALPDAPALVDDLIRHGWIVQAGQTRPDFAQLAHHLAQGALLIVDGLDECLVHLVDAQHPQFVQTWLNLIADVQATAGAPEPRLLLSCRTNFFKTLADQRNLFTGQHRGQVDAAWYEALVLLPLDEAQIDTYLRASLPGMDHDRVKELIAQTHNLGELAQRPMTLKLIGEHIRELEAMRLRGETVNSAALYGLVAKKWLERDAGKHHLQPEHKLRLMPALAAHLWRNGVRSLAYDELHRWFHQWRAAQPDLAERYAPAVYNQTKLEEDLRTATFVVREDAAEDHAEGFRFAHSSLAEYFLARHLADAVAQDRPDDWAMARPSAETLHFLAELLQLEQARPGNKLDLAGILNRWRKTYRPQASELLLAYGLAAGAAPRPLLAGFNLAGARLRGWRFGTPRFEGQVEPLPMSACDFSGADLREARFDQVRLDGGDFGGARLDRAALQHCGLRLARFGEASLVGTVFRHCACEEAVWTPLGTGYRTQWVACAGLAAELPPAALVFPGSGSAASPPGLRAHLATLAGHGGSVWSVAFSPDGRRLLSGGLDGTLRLWDADSGEALATLAGHGGSVWSVAFSPDGRRLLSGGDDGALRLWDADSGEALATLAGHEGWVLSVAFSPDGRRLLSGGEDGALRLWDTDSGETLATLVGHEGWVFSVALSPDGCRFLSGGEDGALRLWDTDSGEALATLVGHEGPVRSVAFSPDGRRLLSGGEDGALRLWDADSGEALATLAGHEGWVFSVAFSPDGGRLLSGGDDDALRLWGADSGEALATLAGHGGSVRSVAFSPDGRRLLSGGLDGVLRLWDADSGEALRGYCAWNGSDVEGVAVWRPSRAADDPGELIAAAGDAWRVLAWQVWDHPSAPGQWTRMPLVY